MSEIYLSLSVHDVVNFLLRKGDIDTRVYNDETMALGSKIHASFQKKQGKEYLSEVPLEETFKRPLGTIHLEGRADGIIIGGDYPIVDEIKSTVSPLEEFSSLQSEWHFGQAICYALMYAHSRNENRVGVRITYLSQLNDDSLRKERLFSLSELEETVNSYLDRYLAFYTNINHHKERVKESAKSLSFPYQKFRAGQREMAKFIYSICRDGGTFFCEAPTGIGKTMSALYPAIKSLAGSSNEKIFYLTAKSTGRESAFDAVSLLKEKGLYIRDSLLRAKEKMCFCLGKSCNPDDCPFARGYFEKLRGVMEEEMKENHRFSIDYVKEIAKKNEMCPFELQLDLSLLSDIVICDFNYFFDPFVHLDRYFGPEADASHYVVLIDEAHNLVDRAKSMYSASLSLSMAKNAKKSLKRTQLSSLRRSLTKFEKYLAKEMVETKKEKEYEALPKEAKQALSSFLDHRKDLVKEKHVELSEEYKDFSREAYRFSSLLSDYSDNSLLYFSPGKDPSLCLLSLDPSAYLRESLEKVKARAIFSATLSPISFYMDAIYGEKAPYLLLSSPFPKKNFSLLVAPMVSTRYKDRRKTMDEVARYLEHFVDAHIGNYFLYFPSYEYLTEIKDKLVFKHAAKFVQEKNMNEDERKLLLSEFQENPTHSSVGLMTIGGSFSEGVDLVGDRLEGVAVVGVGLPTLCYERNKMKEHFDKKDGKGFEYAYLDPGINHVMQAVGRLIRSETDKGVALLIDDRYLQKDYRDVFARSWADYSVVTEPKQIDECMKSIYSERTKSDD